MASRDDNAGLAPPVTTSQIAEGLHALGLRPGDTVVVHSSLRAVAGPRSMVLGGSVAVIDALQGVVGRHGNIVMPTFSADHSEPSRWRNPPAPPSWWPLVRSHWPAYQPDRTPTRGVGRIPETFRAMADVLRSDHPQSSFAAWGADAPGLIATHPLDQALGEQGPLGRLYAKDGRVLLLGAGWMNCTCFHLAEHRMRAPPAKRAQGAPIVRNGERVWVRWHERAIHNDDFEALGDAFEATGRVHGGLVGRASTRLFSIRESVDFAVPWLGRHR